MEENTFKNNDLTREFDNILAMACQVRDNGHRVFLRRENTELPEMPYVIDIEDQSYFYQNKDEQSLDYKKIIHIFADQFISLTQNR